MERALPHKLLSGMGFSWISFHIWEEISHASLFASLDEKHLASCIILIFARSEACDKNSLKQAKTTSSNTELSLHFIHPSLCTF